MTTNDKIKYKHASFPFSWTRFDPQDTDVFTFYNCDVLEDFGVLKKGFYTSITDNGQLGVLEAVVVDNYNNPLIQKYKSIPTE